jgi:hypothetical protein
VFVGHLQSLLGPGACIAHDREDRAHATGDRNLAPERLLTHCRFHENTRLLRTWFAGFRRIILALRKTGTVEGDFLVPVRRSPTRIDLV